MINRKIMFMSPFQVETIEEEYVPKTLGDQEVLVKLIYSLISPGTEMAMLSGKKIGRSSRCVQAMQASAGS
ncbi:hypothetical protein MHH52_18325 [Paenibacillus sp. FSL K6-0276]|uniref:hypothetical protein n=1 Tax=Paenibacillus sp. FSL K6-0276 TaxID=2921450 RepID=UPI0030ECCAF5